MSQVFTRSAFSTHARLPILLVLAAGLLSSGQARAQAPGQAVGEVVPRDVRELYDRGLQYLVGSQSEKGDWDGGGGESGPGITGIALLAFLASGEDPNYGLYSSQVRKAIRSIIEAQNAETGYIGQSMYHHGFATLALAEAYGAVDERTFTGPLKLARPIGRSLELAVRTSVTSQKKNPLGAWRYSPDARDADTSVSGAVLVSLLAARNAGIEVSDESIDQAVKYFISMTSDGGQVGYSGIGGFGESHARTSIAALVYALARRKDLPQHKSTVDFLVKQLEHAQHAYPEYTLYYQAQALFQGDLVAWEKWNKLLVRQLKQAQRPDGSFPGQQGPVYGTGMSLLALALNFRFLPIYER